MLDNQTSVKRRASVVSRYRPVAAATVLILVLSACGSSASPSPSTASPSQAAVASQAASAPAASTAASAAAQDFTGVEVNVLTFTGPQIAEPLQRHAPEFAAKTGAKVNVATVPFSDLYQKILTDL